MDDDTTIGARLAAAREASGLSVQDVADATRVRREFLESIEAMDERGLPERPYVLGFVRAYAAKVGLDPEDAAKAFAAQGRVRRPAARAAASYPRPQPARRVAIPPVAAAGLLGLAAAVALWASTAWDAGPRAPDAIPPVPEALQAWVAAEPGAPEAARAMAALTAQDGPVITLRARIPVWVEVTDVNGARVFASELRAGQVFRTPQQPGLVVAAGNGGGVEVYRDGALVGRLGEPGLPVSSWRVDEARFPALATLSDAAP